MQILSVEVTSPHLSQTLSGRLMLTLESMVNIKHLDLLKPTEVHSVPRITSIQYLRVHRLVSHGEDWEWFRDAGELQEFEITTSEDNEEETSQQLEGIAAPITRDQHILLREDMLEVDNVSHHTLAILQNMPENTKRKVNQMQFFRCHPHFFVKGSVFFSSHTGFKSEKEHPKRMD